MSPALAGAVILLLVFLSFFTGLDASSTCLSARAVARHRPVLELMDVVGIEIIFKGIWPLSSCFVVVFKDSGNLDVLKVLKIV